ncbi:MAG: pyruvate formate lyase family protein [Desulfobacterales bacterium]
MDSQIEEAVSKSIPLTERVQKGCEDIEAIRFSKQPLWKERLTVLTDETVKLPLVKRKALAIGKQLAEMPVKIKDYELIVGHLFQCSLGTGIPFPEYCTAEEIAAAGKKLMHPGAVFGHHCPSYERFLKHGIGGLRRLAEEGLAGTRQDGGNADTESWYESVIMSLDGLGSFLLRYRDLALQLAEAETNPDRKDQLLKIAEISRHLSTEPPRTFREAIQAFWFAHAAFQATRNLLSLGRIDQYLWPFLEEDLANATTTIEQAQELIDLLWLKFNERLQSLELAENSSYYVPDPDEMAKIPVAELSKRAPAPWAGHVGNWGLFLGGNTTAELMDWKGELYNEWLHTTTVGGQTPDGKDATNPVTYLCLNAALRLGLPDPELYVRLHDDSPPELVQRAADVIRTGSAAPSFYNDEIIIPGLEKLGLSPEHARDYTSDGCWEIYSQGRTNFKYGIISLVEILDRALFPERWEGDIRPQWGDPYMKAWDPFADCSPPDAYSFGSFDDLMASFKDRLDRIIRRFIECIDEFRDERLYEIAPLPLLSALTEGPIESGKDLTLDGVTHNFHAPVFAGLSHTADSLAAIKKLCFEDNTIAWPELLDAVKDNWQDREPLRQLVMTKAPAYGNDDDYADDIARDIVETCVEKVRHYGGRVKHNHLKFPVALGTFQSYVGIGAVAGATPDGRLGNQPISSNASPSVGRAANGQTAALNSYCKLPLIDVPNGAPLDIAMENRAGLLKQMEAFIMSFVEKRGELLTISVNDCEKLRAAQKEPEKYRDLKIRIGGFQSYFTDLPPAMQNWQIKKCEQYAGT